MSSSLSDAHLAGTTVCYNLTVLSSSCNKISQFTVIWHQTISVVRSLLGSSVFTVSLFVVSQNLRMIKFGRDQPGFEF